MQRTDYKKDLIRLYTDINEFKKCSDNQRVFNVTNKSMRAMSNLEIPENVTDFELLIKNLYILFYEGSGNLKRLDLHDDRENVLQKIRELRHHFEHDREHGKNNEVRKKFLRIGDIFDSLIDKKYPIYDADWNKSGNVLLDKLINFLTNYLRNLENPPPADEKQESLHLFYEHDITLFPTGKQKFRETEISEDLYSDTICFIPSFRYCEAPEFGNTRSAIYVTSEAPSADVKGFKKFLLAVEKKWIEWTEQSKPDFFPESKLIPWSVTYRNKLVYGSGTKNLINIISKFTRQTRATISIILQGTHGDDIPQPAFIVIGSDVKGGFFSYNFIDFYLSSVPIDWDWITSFNESLDNLSSFNRKASSYTLKPYSYYVWKSHNNVSLKKKILGGLGRNGYEEKKWHSFEGLILDKDDINTDYELVEDDSWLSEYGSLQCPKDYLNEFVVRFTNPVPSIEEIQKGELIGIRRPKIYLFSFEGRGWTVLGLTVHGLSIMSSD